MTQAYLNGCEWLCEDCGRRAGLTDSYCNGGGEADTPQHCSSCGVFLENPLTSDGYEYVAEAMDDYRISKSGNLEVLKEWWEFYKDDTVQTGRTLAEECPGPL